MGKGGRRAAVFYSRPGNESAAGGPAGDFVERYPYDWL